MRILFCSLKICELFCEKQHICEQTLFYLDQHQKVNKLCSGLRPVLRQSSVELWQTERERQVEENKMKTTGWRWSCRWRSDFKPSRTGVSIIMRSSAEAQHTQTLKQTDHIDQNSTNTMTVNLNPASILFPSQFQGLPRREVFDGSGWKLESELNNRTGTAWRRGESVSTWCGCHMCKYGNTDWTNNIQICTKSGDLLRWFKILNTS